MPPSSSGPSQGIYFSVAADQGDNECHGREHQHSNAWVYLPRSSSPCYSLSEIFQSEQWDVRGNSTACDYSRDDNCPYSWSMASYNGTSTFNPNGSHTFIGGQFSPFRIGSSDAGDPTYTLEVFGDADCDESGGSHEWSDCEEDVSNQCRKLPFNVTSFRVRSNNGSECSRAVEAESASSSLVASTTAMLMAAAAGVSILL